MELFRKGSDPIECGFKGLCCRGEEEIATSTAVSLSLQARLHPKVRVPCTRICTRAPPPSYYPHWQMLSPESEQG